MAAKSKTLTERETETVAKWRSSASKSAQHTCWRGGRLDGKGLINAWKFEVINYEMKKVLFRNEPLPCFEA